MLTWCKYRIDTYHPPPPFFPGGIELAQFHRLKLGEILILEVDDPPTKILNTFVHGKKFTIW